VPQQDAAGAADPFSSPDVDHLMRPEQFTIEHPMMKPEADNAAATVPKAWTSNEAEARRMLLRATSTARETTIRSTRAIPCLVQATARRPSARVPADSSSVAKQKS
jgi:hypothetical protein